MSNSFIDGLRHDLVGSRSGLLQFWGSTSMRPDDRVYVVKAVSGTAARMEIAIVDADDDSAAWTLLVSNAAGLAKEADAIVITSASHVKWGGTEYSLQGATVEAKSADGTEHWPASRGPAVRFCKAMI